MSVLAPGLLVASPPPGDPNFDRSVVLLAAHGPEGAFGWIINGRELMTLPELLARSQVAESPLEVSCPVRLGGPVSPEQVWLVYRSDERFTDHEGQFDVGTGITATASRKVLETIAAGNVPRSLIALVGYAGWAPGQLENEIRSGSWLPIDCTPDLVFDTEPAQAWTAAYGAVGTSPIAFTTRTVGSA
ncbi:MAG TPA: YqgE/AlgH family protein [Polyangiaceae bacterium]|nr:YqgE/AlgH family protein [Polyangiaceae bacterium]